MTGSSIHQDFRDNGKQPRNRLANRISACLCVFMTENDIFRALADPTRRAIFEKLADGAMNASALREEGSLPTTNRSRSSKSKT